MYYEGMFEGWALMMGRWGSMHLEQRLMRVQVHLRARSMRRGIGKGREGRKRNKSGGWGQEVAWYGIKAFQRLFIKSRFNIDEVNITYYHGIRNCDGIL